MLKSVFVYDKDGFYAGKSLAQSAPDGSWVMPPSSTETEPEIDAAHWVRWVDGAWVKVAKPTTAAELVGVVISHESMTAHDLEMRALMEELTKGSDGYTLKRGDDRSWYVEAIPASTIEAQEVESQIAEFDAKVNSIKDRMAIAQLMNDTETIAALQAEYSELMEG